MLPIKGWNKTCLVDYPPYTASTVFVGGCNFKCGFCHNADLVLDFSSIPDISQSEILEHLSSKKMWIDGVCITGGEPLLYDEVVEFASAIKKLGMLVKIDTNGANPSLLKKMISMGIVDRVAMDIKTSLEEYSKVAGVSVDIENIKESASILMDSDIEYEFRTTVIPSVVGVEKISKIGNWLKGAKKYAIQNFRNQGVKLIDGEMTDLKMYTNSDLEEMKKVASSYFDSVEIRS